VKFLIARLALSSMRQLVIPIPNTEEASLPARRSASRFVLFSLLFSVNQPDSKYQIQIPNTQWRHHKNKPTSAVRDAAGTRVRSSADPVNDHWANSRRRVRLECGRSLVLGLETLH